MPWDCRKCNAHMESDAVTVCTNCKTGKGDWTLAADRTRNFVVPTKKFELLIAGTGRAPAKGAGEYGATSTNGYASAATYAKSVRAAERVVCVDKKLARLWEKNKALPPAECVLLVRLWTADAKVAVGRTVEWAAKPAEVLAEWRREGVKAKKVMIGQAEKAFVDARLLFVHGEGEAPKGFPVDAASPEVEVVDLTEADGPDGHAPRIGLAPFKQAKRVSLPVDTWNPKKGWAERMQCCELEFNHESHMLRPEGMDVIHEVLERCASPANKGKRLLIAGHTDLSGDEATVNLPLSRRRCENIVEMLEGDRDGWARSARQSYDLLQPKGKAKADTDLITQKYGDGTFAGFKRNHKRKFPSSKLVIGDSFASDGAWRAVYDFYEQELLGRLGEAELSAAGATRLAALDKEVSTQQAKVKEQEKALAAATTEQAKAPIQAELTKARGALAEKEKAREDARGEEEKAAMEAADAKRRAELARLRAGVQWVDPARKFVPFGERYPKVATADGVKEELNRRDEFLWFPQDRLPWTAEQAPADEAAAQVAVYGEHEAWDYNSSDGPYSIDQLDCPAPPNISVPPGDCVFVIDRSGSMNEAPRGGVAANGRTRIAACRRELQRVLRLLAYTQKFAIISFDHEVQVWGDGALGRADDARVDAACGWAATLTQRQGATNTWGALERALAVKGVQSIVLLSDGLPTVGVTNEGVLIDKVRASGSKVPIFAYGFLKRPVPEEGTPERAGSDAELDAVGAAYLGVVKGQPDAIPVDTAAVDARCAATAKALNAKKTLTADGKAFTAAGVEDALLGWFLWRLARDSGGRFEDLAGKVLR